MSNHRKITGTQWFVLCTVFLALFVAAYFFGRSLQPWLSQPVPGTATYIN